MADQFREAEAAYSVLRMKFNEKKISPQEFADSLKQLRIKDDEGRFWVIGARSGKWYAFERGEWIEAKPPSQLEKKAICIACGFENDLEAEFCVRCGNRPDAAGPETVTGLDDRTAGAADAALRKRHDRHDPLLGPAILPLVLRRLRSLRRDFARPPGRSHGPLSGFRSPAARLLRRAPRGPSGRIGQFHLRRHPGIRRRRRRGSRDGVHIERDPLAGRRS